MYGDSGWRGVHSCDSSTDISLLHKSGRPLFHKQSMEQKKHKFHLPTVFVSVGKKCTLSQGLINIHPPKIFFPNVL